jgi:predicted neuraminidase
MHSLTLFVCCLFASCELSAPVAGEGELSGELIFPLSQQHNHAPGIAELPDGSLIVSWYRGSGERTADDVAVWGARRQRGQTEWSTPFLMADTPGFPDCNTAMMADKDGRLWLFWPVIIANSWESALTHYQVASQPSGAGCPDWDDTKRGSGVNSRNGPSGALHY